MQAQFVEGVADSGLQCLVHESAALVLCGDLVAEIAGLERAAKYLRKGAGTNDFACLVVPMKQGQMQYAAFVKFRDALRKLFFPIRFIVNTIRQRRVPGREVHGVLLQERDHARGRIGRRDPQQQALRFDGG